MEKKSQIDALDGLRGMALLLVLISHLSGVGLNVLGLNLAGIGKYGVYLFFVLSSFLLSIPIIKYSETYMSNKKAWVNYFVRRFFRIYPLFFCVLLVSFLSTLILGDYTGGKGLPFTMTFNDVLQHLVLQKGYEVLWSIPVEFKFYFFLPILLFVYAFVLRKNITYSALFTLFIVVLSMVVWPESDLLKNDIRLGPYIPLFVAGVMSALVHVRLETKPLNRGFVLVLETLALLSLLMVFLLTPLIYKYLSNGNISNAYFVNKFYIFSLLWSVIIISSVHGSGYVKKIFSNNILRFVGLVSYSAYLLHIGVIKIINNYLMFNSVIKGWLVILVTLCVSYVSYKLIEKPFSKIRVDY